MGTAGNAVYGRSSRHPGAKAPQGPGRDLEVRLKITALAGGVGGAKLAHGLAQILLPGSLTVIVNTADDFEHLGLRISPDLDTVCYTLAGLANAKTGWGRADETWKFMASLLQLGGPDWFRLGDKDLATHVERTRRLRNGQTLTQVLDSFRESWDIQHTILPMTNQQVATIVATDEGPLGFQEYFVHRQCRPRVNSIRFEGIENALPAPGVLDAIQASDGIVICPSNPWVSIGPILAVRGMRAAMAGRNTVAVSPIVGGRALKGPADKMYREMGRTPSALEVARDYQGLLRGLVFDQTDASLKESIEALGMHTRVVDTVMRSVPDRVQLARHVLDFLEALDR